MKYFSIRSSTTNPRSVGFNAFFSLAVVVQLVTLPVEFNASRRALVTIEGSGLLSEDEWRGARSVLRAAALTYVAALLTSVVHLLRYVLIFLSRRKN